MEFFLTESLASQFLTQYVNKLNQFYNNFVQPGFYDRQFYNFQLTSGNRFAKIDYLFDEYLPNKYLFYSIEYKVKFLNLLADDASESVAVCLPINAIDVFSIKIDKLPNMPDIKKDFAFFMHNFFGDEFKNILKTQIEKTKNHEKLKLKNFQQKSQQNIDYLNSFFNF